MADAGTLPYPIQLSGDGVVLREWRAEDLDDLVVLLDEADVARWTPIASPFDTDAGVAYLLRARQGRLSGRRIQLAVTVDGGRPLGEVLLFGLAEERREAELGYVVGAAHRRRGLASGALSLLSRYARDTLRLSRLLLRIDPGNAASCAVARRCGYRRTGEPPVAQESPQGPLSLDTWELLASPGARRRGLLRRATPGRPRR